METKQYHLYDSKIDKNTELQMYAAVEHLENVEGTFYDTQLNLYLKVATEGQLLKMKKRDKPTKMFRVKLAELLHQLANRIDPVKEAIA